MTEGTFRDWPLPASPPTEPPPAPPGLGGPSGPGVRGCPPESQPSPPAPPPGDGRGTRPFAGKRTIALVGGVAALALVAGSLGAAIGVSLASKDSRLTGRDQRHRPVGRRDDDSDPHRDHVHD